MKWMAWVLIFSTIWLGVAQRPAQAMLVPSTAGPVIVDQVSENADLQTIQSTLDNKAIRARLHRLGLSDAEIQSRLARLSEAQKHQLASQIRAVNPAGDGIVVGLLVIVVLVLLIIFLAKRI